MTNAGPLEVLAQSLAAGTALLTQDGPEGAEPADLAALLEVYVRVASRSREDRVAAGLDDLFQSATKAWVEAGRQARTRAVEGLGCDELVETAYGMAEDGSPEAEDIVAWAAAVVRCALVLPWLDPPERAEVMDAVAECTTVADSHPEVFLAAAVVPAVLAEEEPVDRWPREAREVIELLSRLPLLAVVDGEL